MWTRKELKDKAKVSLKTNYWKAVLVGLLVLVISGGMGFSFSNSAQVGDTFGSNNDNAPVYSETYNYDDFYDDYGYDYDFDEPYFYENDNVDSADSIGSELTLAQSIALGIGIFIIVLFVLAVALAVAAFILGPLEVGAYRFFLRNLNQKTEVKEVAYAFDHNYLETVKTMFLRDIFIMLWSLLFIVPGIVKSYEYRMIPYLMAEDPTMTKDQAFAISKQMMTGQKWNAFVLDLSFLGWNILSLLTLGALAVFYVAPYQNLTNAALYEKLRYGLPQPDPQAMPYNMPPVPPASTAAPVAPYAAPAYAATQATAPVYYAPVAPSQPGNTSPMGTTYTATQQTAAMPVVEAPAPAAERVMTEPVARVQAEELNVGDIPSVPAADAMKESVAQEAQANCADPTEQTPVDQEPQTDCADPANQNETQE